jgi:DNA-binding SARP family transcriptional activator/Tfp pilus assembly protein PilF
MWISPSIDRAMIDLRTLGALDLRASDGHDVTALLRQPKRCALLVYLALAGSEGFRRRDTVVALFWPKLDDQHARGALRQALRFLRRVLGDGVITTRGEEEIGIEPRAVTIDVRAFEQSCETGNHAKAIALYGGDFLDGIFLSDASPAFEQWVDEQRGRLRTLAARTTWAVAEARRAGGDVPGALDMARRAAGFSPDSEAEVAREIAFLDASGDRAGALAAYDRLARRLAVEFDAEPAPETRALIHEIRTRTEAASTPQLHRPASRPNAAVPVASDPRVPARVERRPRTLFLVFAAGFVAAIAYLATVSGHPTAAARPARPDSTSFTPADTTLAERAGHMIDARARTLYVRARYWLGRRGRDNLLKAVATFQEALDIEPTYAAAYSGMGDAYAQLGYGGFLRPDDAFPKAKAAASRALELDSTIAEPHATLGYVAMYYTWDWTAAESEYRLALALNPAYPTAHEWYGLFLAAMGRFDEAQAHERRAAALDPLSLGIQSTAGWVLHYSGKQADAERQLRIALRTDSTFPVAHLYLGRVLQFNGQLDSALAHFAAMGSLRAWVPTLAGEGYVYAQQGHRDHARQVLQRLDSLSRTQYVTAYAVALVYAALGERDSAFVWLNKAVDERTHWVLWLDRDRRWDPIRSDDRFRAIVRRVRLPD